MKVESAILVGGYSSRMKCPKHSLLLGPTEHRRSLLEKLIYHHYQFQTTVLQKANPQITISVRDLAQKLEVQQFCETFETSPSYLKFVVDSIHDAGPVAGLIAVHHSDASAHWLVTGCDYPLLETETLQKLWSSHTVDTWTTCFQNDGGFYEPLLAIWSPTSLQNMEIMVLEANETGRKFGPTFAIRAFSQEIQQGNGKGKVICVRPENSMWLRNVNTPADWQKVVSMTDT